jgi:epoxyqueuosine reductase
VVDTAPLLEREFAQLAGIGWIGKNTLLLNQAAGSYFFLAALLTDLELAVDQPYGADHCGTCTACLDACPTQAFPAPYQLDASRCVSYLTIELRSEVPTELRSGIGEWIFGCDICQEVCPWNRRAPVSLESAFQPCGDLNPIELGPLFFLSEEQFRVRFRKSPLWRPKRRGLLRNAAIALGNQACETALEPLMHGLCDVEPIVRSASAWALGQLQPAIGSGPLRERLQAEPDESVCCAIRAALGAV